ncbi:MAG: DUF4271 domain-containing protein [Paludibacter sp.]
MPLPDTIRLTSDSAMTISDSLQITDSLTVVDSTSLIDTLKAQVFTGFAGIPHPSLPCSENWVFGVILVLFLILVVSLIQNLAWIRESIRTFFQVKERSSFFSKNTVISFRTKFLLVIFSSGVFSLYAYYWLYNPENGFHLSIFLWFYLITISFLIVKFILSQLIGYVFLDSISIRLAKESYFNVLTYMGITLFPALILQIYFPSYLNSSVAIFSLALCVLAAILIIIKLFQIFFKKSIASFYILLYLCTLEILPIIILLKVFRLII